jgi:hypothetical protein
MRTQLSFLAVMLAACSSAAPVEAPCAVAGVYNIKRTYVAADSTPGAGCEYDAYGSLAPVQLFSFAVPATGGNVNGLRFVYAAGACPTAVLWTEAAMISGGASGSATVDASGGFVGNMAISTRGETCVYALAGKRQ